VIFQRTTPRQQKSVYLALAILALPVASPAQPDVDFRTATAYTVVTEPNSLTISDLDVDGHLDVAAAGFEGSAVSILLGDGSGGLQRVGDADTTGRPLGIAAGRFDADALPDLVTTQQESDNMWFLRNLGDGMFAAPQLILGGHDPWAVTAVDFDGDGRLDVLQSLLPEVGGRVNVLYGNGDGTFGEAIGARTGGPNSAVAAADFDGDGRLDAIATNLTRASVSVLLGREDETLAPHRESGVGDNPTGVAVGDLDEDGSADVVVSSTSGDAVTVSIGIGDGRFQPASSHPVGDAPVGIAVVDLDGDHHLDVAVGNRGEGTVSLLFGDGSGDLTPPRTYIADQLPLALAIGDLNEDQVPDIVTSNAGDLSSSVTVLLGNGRTLEAVEQLASPVPSTALAVGDLDGDAVADIVAALPAADALAIYLRREPTSAPMVIDLGAAPTAVAVVDVDGDDRADLVVALEGSSDLTIFINEGDDFAEPVRVPAGGVPVSIGAADYNVDGIIDLAAALTVLNEIVVLRGEGGGGFSAPRRTALPGNPVALTNALIDANGTDLAVALASGVVAILLGGSGGDLELVEEVAVATEPVALAALEVNDDAFDDLAVVHTSGATRVLLGDGRGEFTSTTLPGLSELPTSIDAHDVTGDGRADLLISERGRNSVAILASAAAGSFAVPVRIRVGEAPRAVRAGDFDGDGGYDLAASCMHSSLAFNRRDEIVRGDGNGDTRVGAADLVAVTAAVRAAQCTPPERHPFIGIDADGDGLVCPSDLRAAALRIFL
jgi:hypothetical protein